MKRYVQAGSFNRARKWMNELPCCFVTAWRNDLTTKEKVRQNRLLASDIRAAGLTYFNTTGGYVENKGTDSESRVIEQSFMVVNNKYVLDDFVKLCVHWCRKYNQDAVLVTVPSRTDNGKALQATGKYYDKNGNVVSEYSNVTVGDVEEYFSNMYGKDFVLSSCQLECYTTGDGIHTVNGRRISQETFKDLYPEL